jgi:osmotically-inducible protein OsmY
VLSVYERPDDDILTEILTDVIAAEFGLAASAFDVCVTSGIVAISGLMEQAGAALALVARLRRVEGVVAVRDRVSIGQPSAGQQRGSLAGDSDAAAGDLAGR